LTKSQKIKLLKQQVIGNIEFINRVLGVGGKDAIEWFQQGVSESDREKIESLIKERTSAKKDRDFKRADAIREELKEMGINIMDTPQGTKWEKI